MERGKIGENLRKIRAQKKLTQRELGDDMDCSEVYISNIEREIANPSMKTVINMANSLNVPLTSIIDRDGGHTSIDREYSDIFSDLSSPGTVCVLKMLYDIKKHIIEYERYNRQHEYMVAEGETEGIDYKAVGESIAGLRKEKNIPRSVIARRLKMNIGSYSNIENSNATASIKKYMEIADEFNVSIDYLFEKSLVNKCEVSREYIHRIFRDVSGTEKHMLVDIARELDGILNKYGI